MIHFEISKYAAILIQVKPQRAPWDTISKETIWFDFFTCDSWRVFFPSARQLSLAEWLAGLSCLHVAEPCQFFQRERGGRFLHDSGQPQTTVRDLPLFSSISAPKFNQFLFTLWRGIPCLVFVFLRQCLLMSRLCEKADSSSNGPLRNERWLCGEGKK